MLARWVNWVILNRVARLVTRSQEDMPMTLSFSSIAQVSVVAMVKVSGDRGIDVMRAETRGNSMSDAVARIERVSGGQVVAAVVKPR